MKKYKRKFSNLSLEKLAKRKIDNRISKILKNYKLSHKTENYRYFESALKQRFSNFNNESRSYSNREFIKANKVAKQTSKKSFQNKTFKQQLRTILGDKSYKEWWNNISKNSNLTTYQLNKTLRNNGKNFISKSIIYQGDFYLDNYENIKELAKIKQGKSTLNKTQEKSLINKVSKAYQKYKDKKQNLTALSEEIIEFVE